MPTALVNQIAAGEVIERPASVVKELLENALDAKARQIDIAVEAGGLQRIEIRDDGLGIHPEDLPLAVMNHATSKIHALDDLFSVGTLGFRGEALASIASVSHFSMISKLTGNQEAYELICKAADSHYTLLPKAHPEGTTVIVRDLFHNTPVRRKFLSSEKTEWRHIETVIRQIALSAFETGFKLSHRTSALNTEKVLWHLPAAVNEALIEKRIRKIFGSVFMEQSARLDAERGGMYLRGWVGLPAFMRSQNDLQYAYLNGRIIRDKLILHAIRAAYEGVLYPGRQPAYLLYLDVDPACVDVNVHPTKHEVRFREPRQVHDFIVSELSAMLSSTSVMSVLEHVDGKNRVAEPSAVVPYYQLDRKPWQEPFSLYWLNFPYCLLKRNKESNEQIIVCDWLKLYRTISKSRFLQALKEKNVVSRPLLVPLKLAITSKNWELISTHLSALSELGVLLERLDEGVVIIRSFPALVPYLDLKEWLTYWFEALEKKKNEIISWIDCFILADNPPWLSDQSLILGILSDFQHFMHFPERAPDDLESCYRFVLPEDWAKFLKS